MKTQILRRGVLAVGLLTASASQVSAVAILDTTLVQDQFDRSGNFVGSSPNIGGPWNGGNAVWATNGSELDLASNGLAFISISSLVPNETYTLTMDVSVDSGAWIGLGFGNSGTTSINFGSTAGMLHRRIAEVELFSSGNNSQDVSVAAGFPKQLQIRLETGSDLTMSTASWFVNGSQIGTDRTVNASTVDRVFIEEFGGTSGTIDNFRLVTTATVPEPSSILLAGLGALGLMRRRRTGA